MAITQEVNIEMLEKLPDGNFKKKNPQTNIESVKNLTTTLQGLTDSNKIHEATSMPHQYTSPGGTKYRYGITEQGGKLGIIREAIV